MNEEARDVLVAAALNGHKQIKKMLHDRDGDCALGVLHIAVHDGNKRKAQSCWAESKSMGSSTVEEELIARFGVTLGEAADIAHRNDVGGQDFLTISRKVGHE